MASLTLGDTVREYRDGKPITGFLTRLDWTIRSKTELIEDNLGYHRGRLSHGFYLLLLKELVRAEDFEFGGIAMFSGGRTGLPSNAPDLEKERRRISDVMKERDGKEHYDYMRGQHAKSYVLDGPERLVKIVPCLDHDPTMGAADQYPRSLYVTPQIILTKPKNFFVAAEIHGGVWRLWNGVEINADLRADYTRPMREAPLSRLRDLLYKA